MIVGFPEGPLTWEVNSMAGRTNRSPEAERLRTGSTLRILGAGVIIFGIWAVIKPAIIAVAAPALSGGYNLPPEDRTAAGVIGVVVLGAVIILLRLYVGLSAWREGSGTPQGRGYVIWAAIMLLFSILMFCGLLFFIFRIDSFNLSDTDITLDTLASALVDITSNIILLELIWNAVKLKRLNKRKGG